MITRRDFIKKTAVGTAALSLGGILPGFSAKSYANIIGANDRIHVGMVGVNSRGLALSKNFALQPNCRINEVCDVDSRALERCIAEVSKISDAFVRALTGTLHARIDYSEVMDNKKAANGDSDSKPAVDSESEAQTDKESGSANSTS